MRVVKLLMLGVMLFAAGVCFEQAWQSSRDVSERLSATESLSNGEMNALPLVSVLDFEIRRPAPTTPSVPPPEAVAKSEEPEVSPLVEETLEPAPQPTRRSRSSRRPKIETPAAGEEEAAPSDPSLVAPEDAFRMALRRKRSALEHCYEQELKKQAAFDGFVVVSVSLSAAGRVTEAHVEEGTRRDAQVGACIVAQLRQLQLPPLTEDVDLIIPIRLEARKPT